MYTRSDLVGGQQIRVPDVVPYAVQGCLLTTGVRQRRARVMWGRALACELPEDDRTCG